MNYYPLTQVLEHYYIMHMSPGQQVPRWLTMEPTTDLQSQLCPEFGSKWSQMHRVLYSRHVVAFEDVERARKAMTVRRLKKAAEVDDSD
jgi:hypothetical protein